MDKSVKIAQVNELNFYLNWDYVKDVCNEAVRKENEQLHKFLEEFNALEVAKENEQLKLIIKRTKASGNYPGRVSAYKARIIHLSEENQQLKELLKESKEKLKYCVRETYELQTKIDNAIGEKK